MKISVCSVVAALLSATAVVAEPSSLQFFAPCGTAEETRGLISNQYQENRRAVGMTDGPIIVEFWANAITGTWSVTYTLPDGRVCLVSSGGKFQETDEPVVLVPQGELN